MRHSVGATARLAAGLAALCAFCLSAPVRGGEGEVDFERLRAELAKTPAGLRLSGRYAEALAALEKSNAPADEALRAEILTETGRDVEAAELADKALEAGDKTPELLTARARALLVTGDYAGAERDLQAAVAAAPADRPEAGLRARLLLADMYRLLARRDDKLDQADAFFDFYNPDAEAGYGAETLFLIGAGVVLGENVKEGLTMFVKAQRKDASFLPAYVRIGGLFVDAYQYADGEKEFRNALRLNPASPEALVGLSRVLACARDTEQAGRQAELALKTDPRCVPALLALAGLEFLDERDDQALALLEKALAINPRHPEALAQQAAVAHVAGRAELERKARASYRAALESLPCGDEQRPATAAAAGQSRLECAVAQALSARRGEEEAVVFARRAAELDQNNPEAAAACAVSLMRNGLDEEAGPMLRRAHELDRFNVAVSNLLKMRQREADYLGLDAGSFNIRIHKDEYKVLAPYAAEFAQEQLASCERLFEYKIGRNVSYRLMLTQEDFSARVTGLPRLDASGATFGPFVALVSPGYYRSVKQPRNWESVSLHELCHVVTLMGSDYRIPRWLTEGMSVYLQGEPEVGWDSPFKTMVEHELLPDLAVWNRDFTRPQYSWQVPAAYMAAGLCVEWMVVEYGKEALPKLLQLYRAGKQTPEVFQEVFGKSVKEMNEWLALRLRQYASSVQAPVLEDPGRLEEYAKLYSANPDDRVSALKLLRVYLMTDAAKAAELAAELARRGKELAAQKDPAAGDRVYSQAIDLHAARLAASGAAGDAAAARELLDISLEVNPGGSQALYLLALLDAGEGNVQSAERRLRAAIAGYPRFVSGPQGSPYLALAELLQGKNDAGGAAEVLEEYCKYNRDDPQALYRLLALYGKLGDDAGRMSCYRRIMGIDPFVKADHLEYARLLSAAGKTTEAARELAVAEACPEAPAEK